MCGWLSETVDTLDIFQGVKLRAESTVYAKELLVHHCCEREAAECLHTSIVDLLGVFVFAFELECEIVCQMSALVVASEQPQGIGVPYLERPEIQNAL
jgi:hypothetical protein